MGRPRHQQTITLLLTPLTVFSLALQAVQRCGWKVENVNPVGGMLQAIVGMSMTSNGALVHVQVQSQYGAALALAQVAATVVVSSECRGMQLVDWGSNRRNCEKFEMELLRLADALALDASRLADAQRPTTTTY